MITMVGGRNLGRGRTRGREHTTVGTSFVLRLACAVAVFNVALGFVMGPFSSYQHPINIIQQAYQHPSTIISKPYQHPVKILSQANQTCFFPRRPRYQRGRGARQIMSCRGAGSQDTLCLAGGPLCKTSFVLRLACAVAVFSVG